MATEQKTAVPLFWCQGQNIYSTMLNTQTVINSVSYMDRTGSV